MSEFKPGEQLAMLCEAISCDVETGILRWRRSMPNGRKAGAVVGSLNAGGYRRFKYRGKHYFAHHVVFYLAHGRWPSGDLDHVDGCRDSNGIANLRECTDSENKQNIGVIASNTSGYPGVCWHKRARRWKAAIRVAGRTVHLGYFDTPEEGYAAYRAAKVTAHPFAPQGRNLPEIVEREFSTAPVPTKKVTA